MICPELAIVLGGTAATMILGLVEHWAMILPVRFAGLWNLRSIPAPAPLEVHAHRSHTHRSLAQVQRIP